MPAGVSFCISDDENSSSFVVLVDKEDNEVPSLEEMLEDMELPKENESSAETATTSVYTPFPSAENELKVNEAGRDVLDDSFYFYQGYMVFNCL